ncbi:MAG: hypothetical protein AAFX78_03600 [Cyanobacteria bacterium J06638_20]
MPAAKPKLTLYRATADIVLDDGTMIANSTRELDPTDKSVAAFVAAGKLVEAEQPKTTETAD